MDYIENGIISKQSHSESPLMGGERIDVGMFFHVQYENLFIKEGTHDIPGLSSFNGIGVLLGWKEDSTDVWMEVLCGDHIITMPLHYGSEIGTPTTIVPL